MADEQPQGQQAAPPEKPKKSWTDIFSERWGDEIITPSIAAGIATGAHKVAGVAASGAAAGFGLGYLVEQHVKKEGNPEIKTERLIPEAFAGGLFGTGVYYGSQLASSIPKALGLEALVSGTFASLGNIGLGAATFGILTFGLPLLYYPVSNLLNGGKEGMWKDLKETYFKNFILKMGLNAIPSLAVMDAYSGYTWTSYLASAAVPYAASLSSSLAPYVPFLVSPALLLGIGAGLGLAGLYAAYRIAFSREKISYGKLLMSPVTGTYNLLAGIGKTIVDGFSGLLKRINDVYISITDNALSTNAAMMGAVPAAKKG
ncbi:hypothetical protein HYX07_02220 [Candidatus Woesearchaeota archaeon]|nr:hypothetical protein [Candidatus Woesearchaeota archaeon]